jgi:hypothetical protein
MYYFEKAIFQQLLKDENEEREKGLASYEEAKKAEQDEFDLIRETGHDKSGNSYHRIHESASATPRAPGSVYMRTPCYLDFRTPFGDKRGIITLVALLFGIIVWVGPLQGSFQVIAEWIRGTDGKGTPIGFESYFSGALILIMSIALLLPYLYCVYKFFRLEIFVQRRMLVRFDRINRKVYVHRPRYAGGIVALNWDNVLFEPVDETKPLIDISPTLCWKKVHTPHGITEIVMVGRRSRYQTEMFDCWEYIRRFMEKGPASVPNIKLIGRIPWPWRSLESTFGMFWPFFSFKELNWMSLGLVIILPGIILFAAVHWISLLLCWEPVFPRAIRKASGESWLDVLETRLIDIISWAMLAGVLWLAWPLLKQSVMV